MPNVIDTKSVEIRFAGRVAETIKVYQWDTDSYSLSKTSNSSLNVVYSFTFGDRSGTDVPVHVWLQDNSQSPPKIKRVKTVTFSDITSLTAQTSGSQI